MFRKVLTEKEGRRRRRNARHSAVERRKVNHWVPAICIPDGKTSSCMTCDRSFGWHRRRHHCHLCVDDVFVRLALDRLVPLIIYFRVDLISVSFPLIIFLLQTFFISDFNAKHDSSSSPSTKPARALPVSRRPHALIMMAIDTTCNSRDVISSFDDDNNNIDDVGSETEE